MSSFNAGANCFLASPHLERVLAPNPATERGQAVKVNAHPSLPLIIYPSGKFIVVKNYLNPAECFVYRGHSTQTTVAKFSPNGFWVASADISGKVRVWSWDNPEHLMKIEVPVFAAAVGDLDWDSESKKIVAVGDGSGILVKCFAWDTGSAAGEMLGHNKRVLSVAYRPARPFRIMSGGEDFRCLFYAGPPFKLDHSNATHTNFVNSVRYSPNGVKVVSVGTDKKIQVYDGTSGEPSGEVLNAHDGGIYAVAFNSASTHFATASADKTVKIWNADSLACEQTIPLSADPQISDAQVAVVWARDQLLSVSLNGDINLLTPAGAVDRVIQSHQTGITAMCLDKDSQVLYTGSAEGVVCARSLSDYSCTKVIGTDKKSIPGGAHSGKIVGLALVGDQLLSVGWDDKLRSGSASSRAYNADNALNGQPCFMTKSSDLVVVLTNAELAFFRGSDKISATALSVLGYTPTCAALLGEEELALGGSDSKTHVYALDGGMGLTERTAIETRSAVTSLAYSPAGDMLAIGDTGRQVEVYERGSWAARIKGKWVFHTSKITALSWSPSGSYLASGSLDENIFIWNLAKPTAKLQLSFSHMGGVSGLDWSAEDKLVSVGNDATVAIWKIPSVIA